MKKKIGMDLEPQITTLSDARLEIALKSEEIAKKDEELLFVNQKLKHEKKERRNRTADLVIANEELSVQSKEKVKRAKEFKVVSQELTYQQSEKEQRKKDLVIAYRKLTLQCKYFKQCSAKLRAANRTLVKENKNKDKLAQEFFLVHEELLNAQSKQKAYIAGLSKVMDIISHKLRQPVVQIMGLTSLFSEDNATTDTIEMNALIKESAGYLDSYTRELTELIHIQEIEASQGNNH